MNYKNIKNILGFLLVFFFFLSYFNLSSGTFGGDSDGYFLGAYYLENEGKMSNVENPQIKQYISQDFDFDSIEYLIPNRYSLNKEDNLVYRYPPGISYLISFFNIIFLDILGYNFLVSIFASLSVLLFYLFLTNYFEKNNLNLFIAFASSLILGSYPLFISYSTAQPMREIIIIFFNNLILYFLSKNNFFKSKKYIFLILSLMTISLYVRYTNIFIYLLFLPLVFEFIFKIKKRKLLLITGVKLGLLVLILLIPLGYFNMQNTSGLEPQSFDHVKSIKFSSIYDNTGKYKPHEGGLFVYLNQFSFKLLPFLLIGLFVLIKTKKLELILIPLLILFLFSMWVNPYERYILPIIPFVIFFVALGYNFILNLKDNLSLKLIFSLFFLLLVLPATFSTYNNYFLEKENSHKSLSLQKYENLKILNDINGLILIDGKARDCQGFIQFMLPQKEILKMPKQNYFLNRLKVNNDNIYLITLEKDKDLLSIGFIGVSETKNLYIYKLK